ncbi:hypothetical protein [Cellulosimicrobium cellulans]|uniref:hypothetical protein n=1 Tax=Cellulosimicrobium cellulans TaxID=1710 RepID=UPI002096C0AD|nr:hypothetical protein [Cellulosimicrobium cellulans]MCO7273296.1 hypothetical protein [Cellulosimicrobium cellulans]
MSPRGGWWPLGGRGHGEERPSAEHAAAAEAQTRLLGVLAKELAAAQTEPWDELSYRAFVVADRTQSHVSLRGAWPPPLAQKPTSSTFAEALAELRAATAAPGRGAWFTVSMTVRADGEVDASYDVDTEPGFLPPAGPADFARDLERFPRSVEAQPTWLRERLSWARLTSEQRSRAEAGVGALQPYPALGGSRPLFTVTVTPEDDVVDVLDHATGRRALVDRDGTVRLVAPDPSARPS